MRKSIEKGAIMSISLNVNTTDTSISGFTPASLTVAALNFAADYRVTQRKGNEVTLTNITAPTDAPETYRFGYSEIPNIYMDTGIEKSMWLPTKRGLSVILQLKSVYSLSDSADATYRALLPMWAHMVLRYPNHQLVTPAVVQTHIKRMLAGLYDTGTTDTSRLSALMRGSVLPKDL